MMPSGWTDKLYWRNVGRDQRWHCYKKNEDGGFISLCGKQKIYRVGTQKCMRPPPMDRCGVCDGREMDRRGWSESGPTTLVEDTGRG